MGLGNLLDNLSEEAQSKIEAWQKARAERMNKEAEEAPKDQKFIDATLSDGTVVMVEPNLEIGAMVTLEVEGEVVAAPDGAHELEDGTVITTEGGVITDLQPAEEMDQDNETPKVETPTEKEAREHKKEIVRQEVEKIFTAEECEAMISKATESLKEDFAKMLNALKEESEELKEGFKVIVEGLGEMPSDKPAQEPKKQFGKVNKWRAKLDAMKAMKK